MHKWLAAVIIMLLAYPALAEAQGRGGGRGGRGAGGGAGPAAPTGPVAGHGVDVPGYWARRDNPEELKQGLKFAPSNGGIRATTGPAAIFWHPSHEASGKYTVSARFTVPKVPATQEAFGLFVGGQNLSDDDQRYVHFHQARRKGLDPSARRRQDEQRGRRVGRPRGRGPSRSHRSHVERALRAGGGQHGGVSGQRSGSGST
jgi:hypothetical protein